MKEKVADDTGLVANHTSVSNAFSINAPAAGSYAAGLTISVVLNFPFNVNVSGSPRLALTVGSVLRHAYYATGTGTKNLTFSYVIVAADNDTDGVQLLSLELNGGVLNFTTSGNTLNCDTSSVTEKTFSSVLIDNTAPAISSFAQSNLPRFYNVGETLSFTMGFSEKVFVTGTPRFAMAFSTGGSIFANYVGGSGTKTLVFSYAIQNTVADTDGYIFTSPMDLNSGTIKDLAGNNSSLDYSSYTAAANTYSSTIDFDGQLPYVISVTAPANGTYVSAQNLNFTVQFDRAVTVTGSPYLELTVGGSSRQATYISGSGSANLVFRYTTVPGDVAPTGITVAALITANAGTIIGTSAPIQSYFLVAANNDFSAPNTSGIIINSIQPMAISLSRSVDTTLPTWGAAVADNVWITGQNLTITVAFNTNMYVTQTSGTPRIPLTIGATTRYADYLSGGDGQSSLIFRYLIQAGDLDADTNITLSNIDLNGGIIADVSNTNSLLTLPIPALTTTSVDGVNPTISSVVAPSDKTYSTLTGNNHLNMTFTVNWSEPVNLSSSGAGSGYLGLTIGATPVNAEYTSGNNTAIMLHNVASLATYNDTNGIVMSSPFAGTAVIKDLAGNTATVLTYTLPNTASILVDTTVPTVTSVASVPAAGTYGDGANLDFSITFSEFVTTNVASGYPRIPLTIGSTTRYLVPTSNMTALTHTFRYTITTNETDADGIVMGNAVTSDPSGYVRDAGQNVVSGTFSPTAMASVLVDGTAPTMISVTRPSNGVYTSGDVLSFSVQYSEPVTVTGSPRIQVPLTQTGVLDFLVTAGNGTNTLTFSRTLTSSDFDFDGLSSAVTSIDLNGGNIRDVGNNPAPTSLTSTQNLSNLFIAYPNTQVWVASNFVNNMPSGPSISSAGSAIPTACGGASALCRPFDGDDALMLGSALAGVETVFIVFEAPAGVVTQDLISPDIVLENDGAVFDLTADGSLNLNGTPHSASVLHDVNIATSSMQILQVDFATSQNFGIGALIPLMFAGRIGEVIMFNGSLSAPQKTQIRNYLSGKF